MIIIYHILSIFEGFKHLILDLFYFSIDYSFVLWAVTSVIGSFHFSPFSISFHLVISIIFIFYFIHISHESSFLCICLSYFRSLMSTLIKSIRYNQQYKLSWNFDVQWSIVLINLCIIFHFFFFLELSFAQKAEKVY